MRPLQKGLILVYFILLLICIIFKSLFYTMNSLWSSVYLHMNQLKSIENFEGLASIRNIHLDSNLLRSNFKNLVNLKDSIQVNLIKTTRNISMFRSVNIIYSDLTMSSVSLYDQNVLEIDCQATVFLARFNIQLNLKTDAGFHYFFNSCKEFYGKRFNSHESQSI